MSWLTPSRRVWLYDIGTAVTAGLGVWGILGDEKANSINILLAAVFNMARRNVDRGEADSTEE